MNKAISSNRWTIIVVMVLFAAPVLLSTLMHSQWWPYRPDNTRNYGELLQPAVAINGWPDTSSTLDINDEPPIWTLLLNSQTDCDTACQQQLGWLRQIRVAQGRHSHQVAIQLTTNDSLPDAQLRAIQSIDDDLHVADTAQQQQIQQAIASLDQSEVKNKLTTYLIDPAGFIILRYPEQSDVTGIRKDLGRLLTWSNKARGSG